MSTTEPRRVLVTGAGGFTGRFVCAALSEAGHHPVVPADSFDLTDATALRDALAGIEFDAVIHLAAISFVGHDNPAELYRVNTVGTVALLEAIQAAGQASGKQIQRVILASSANIYGNNPVSPIDEGAAPAPVNHYATSKVAMELMARQWHDRLPIVMTRPFNYTGAGQQEHFLVPKIVGHFARRDPAIELGNIDVTRDFSDVRDVAAIYVRLLDAPAGTVVNICSGVGRSLRSILDHCRQATGHQIEVRVNPAFVRADEIHELVGSDARLASLIDQGARRSLDATLDWMLEAAKA
jgi:nucleoside-diphosphate-sugar epimerase